MNELITEEFTLLSGTIQDEMHMIVHKAERQNRDVTFEEAYRNYVHPCCKRLSVFEKTVRTESVRKQVVESTLSHTYQFNPVLLLYLHLSDTYESREIISTKISILIWKSNFFQGLATG